MATSRTSRVKTWLIYISAALIILIFLGLFIYRDDAFQSLQDPGTPFQTYIPPAALQYDDPGSWLTYPESAPEGTANIFVVSPTLYLGGKHWNAPVAEDKLQDKFERIIRPNYVSPFDSAGETYAPYYRQAALYALLTNRDDARRARRFAYTDVSRAFRHMLDQTPPERPIILAGYEQGGFHVQGLLKDYFSGDTAEAQALRQRLVAAYVIDFPLPLDVFGQDLAGLKVCESPDQTSCVISFGTFTEQDGPAARQYMADFQVWNGRRLKSVKDRKLVCVNPLTWTQNSDYAPPRLHLGALAAEGLEAGREAAASPRQFGAQCVDGLLIVDKPRSRSFRRPLRFGGDYITPPYNLFYEDLKQDALRRTQLHVESGAVPILAPPLDKIEEIVDSPIIIGSD